MQCQGEFTRTEDSVSRTSAFDWCSPIFWTMYFALPVCAFVACGSKRDIKLVAPSMETSLYHCVRLITMILRYYVLLILFTLWGCTYRRYLIWKKTAAQSGVIWRVPRSFMTFTLLWRLIGICSLCMRGYQRACELLYSCGWVL
jgi:hypothetical protein